MKRDVSSVAPQLDAVIAELGISPDHVEFYGRGKAKISLEAIRSAKLKSGHRSAKLILVSAISPTPAGEGKTTVSIGLAQGLRQLGARTSLALREPSLGPVFGRKGTATGGGLSTLTPAESINLHFTGDFHAITSAHNLLAAAIDNALYFKTTRLVPHRVQWRRVMDMNDRALRSIQVGAGEVARQSGFDITAGSEIMAALCLADSLENLRSRIEHMLVGFDADMNPVFAKELKVTGAMMALLKEAIKPNLVQSIEGVPCFVHGGPFANIAHGCNSVLATQMALDHSDFVVTEAGFAFDLGGEKFMNIKCRAGGFSPSVVVLVVTLRALKMHGGVLKENLTEPNSMAVKKGLENLKAHVAAARFFERPIVVAINHFSHDTEDEQQVVQRYCSEENIPCAIADVFASGGAGAKLLASLVRKACAESSPPLPFVYSLTESIQDKIQKIAQKIYGADGVDYAPMAIEKFALIKTLGFSHLSVCMAKTQESLSDNAKLLGRPRGFRITIRDFEISSGAGFIVALSGTILRMPALPKIPAAERIDIDSHGFIRGW